MLLIEVTDTRSGHRGQDTKGQHMNPILLVTCDVCFMANFLIQLNSVGWTTIRDGLGYFLVEVRSRSSQGQVKVKSRSGKRGQISKLIFMHKTSIYSTQLITRNPMVILFFFYVANKGKK